MSFGMILNSSHQIAGPPCNKIILVFHYGPWMLAFLKMKSSVPNHFLYYFFPTLIVNCFSCIMSHLLQGWHFMLQNIRTVYLLPKSKVDCGHKQWYFMNTDCYSLVSRFSCATVFYYSLNWIFLSSAANGCLLSII